MEPSGMMDNKSQSRQDIKCLASESPTAVAANIDDENLTDFKICDLGDEEVHFSRHASDYYYQVDGNNNNNNNDNQFNAATTTTRHHQAHRASHNSINFQLDSSSLNNFAYLTADGSQTHHHTTLDQARSSKLLSSLGNKLRRGSNYLNAPTKLVGHYLLGITIQSWSEFFNTARMTRAPKTRHQLTRRLTTNLSHFQGNYLCVSLVLVVYCILTSPLLLIAIVAYLLTLYLVTVRSALGKQTRIFGYRLNLQQQYSFITMLSVPPLWIAGAPSAVFWVIGASFFVVGLHASMFTNDQVLNEQLTGSTTCAAVAAVNNLRTLSCNTRRQSMAEACHDFNGPTNRNKSPIQYYNHYPVVASDYKQGYISLSHETMPNNSRQAAASNLTTTGSSQSTTGGSYVSSTISQWISFGGGGSGGKYLPAKNHDTLSLQTGDLTNGQRLGIDVKIISRDYAGLGRVYEV